MGEVTVAAPRTFINALECRITPIKPGELNVTVGHDGGSPKCQMGCARGGAAICRLRKNNNSPTESAIIPVAKKMENSADLKRSFIHPPAAVRRGVPA